MDTSVSDHNPYLEEFRKRPPSQGLGKGEIEKPHAIRNFVWQMRPATPTDHEIKLGDALEAIFAGGATELDAVVSKLNELCVRNAEGSTWTAENFQAEMARLAG